MFLIRHPSQIASTTLCVHYVSGITEPFSPDSTLSFSFRDPSGQNTFLFFFKHLTFMVFLILRHIREGMLVLTISFRFCEWAMMEKRGGLKRSGQSTAACLIHCITHYMYFCCGYPEEGARPVSMIVCYPQFYWATVTAALHPDCTILKLFKAWITDRKEHQAWWSSADKSSQKWKDTKDHILTDCIIRVYRYIKYTQVYK